MTIGNSVICAVLSVVILAETAGILIYGFIRLRQKEKRKLLKQKVAVSLQIARGLRSIISEKSRKAVLQVTDALGDLELIEEEIKDKIFESPDGVDDTDSRIVSSIDTALCECLESLQFEDYTAQIRDHIRILFDSVTADIGHINIPPQVQKEVTDKCRQIFSIDEEFTVLDHISEDMRK